MSTPTSTTRILAADLSGSLSFVLSNALVEAFNNVLNTTELVLLAIAVVVVTSAISGWLGTQERALATMPLLGNVQEVLHTAQLLATTVCIQVTVALINSSVAGPGARVVTLVAALVLLRITLTTTAVGQRRARTD
jgi:hypothetical protein